MEHQMDALLLSLVNITIVFAVLFFLALVINLIKFAADALGTNRKTKGQATEVAREIQAVETREKDRAPGVSPAKVAAACAAVAACLGEEGFKVVSMKKPSPFDPWAHMGRLENMTSSQIPRDRRY
ncbi:MAG: OadG family protein [Thermanaeromonas sp.]|uniref:OadG family protein n=1 Tax=Thermanaeromonas sp. TaxID=2003697 RepID=UPI00243A7BA6|nr:OadG family protein [Thermanaeromonas sp.]MCG0277789.1 OadG family protein [Thermanaeromonas sp.]